MNNELVTYMAGKAEKLNQNNPNKKKLEELRDRLLKRGT